MKSLLCLVIACTLCTAPAYAENASEKASYGSLLAGYGSVIVVGGSINTLAASGKAVVESVEVVGESMVVVFKDASEASRVTLKLSGKVAGGASLAVGTAVSVVTTASGHALVLAGEVIAFLPNEAGKGLLHHSNANARN